MRKILFEFASMFSVTNRVDVAPRVAPSAADEVLTIPLILTFVAVVAGLIVIVPDAFAIMGVVNEVTDGVADNATVGATVGVPPITILVPEAVTEVTVPLLESPKTVPVNVVVPVALPIVVLPVPVELMLTVGETSATDPAPAFPIVVVPEPVVLTITAGDTRATEFPAVVLPMVVVPLPVVFNPRAALIIGLGTVTLPPPPCCVARTLRYAKTEDVASELATTIGATPDIFKG
jgi:hypothetical protein